MITIEPRMQRYQKISVSEIPDIVAAFMADIDDVDVLKNIIIRHGQSIEKGIALATLAQSKRFVQGLLAAIGVHLGHLRPEVMENFVDSIYLMKYYVILHERANSSERARLWGMLRDAVSKDGDARRFFCEIATVFVYADFGCSVNLTDLGGISKFEFLVEKDSYKFEVEVKTISGLGQRALPAPAFEGFAHAVFTRTNGLKLPHVLNHFQVFVSGTHEKPGKPVADFDICLRSIRQGVTRSAHGCIKVWIKEAPPEDFMHMEKHVANPLLRMPRHLEQFPAGFLLTQPNGRGFLTISFARPWRISRTFERDLDDAFAKFTGERPAVVWLYLTDATPFIINPYANEIGILQNTQVKSVLDKYREKGRYSFPTGLVISGNLLCARSTEDQSEFNIKSRFFFRPSRGLAVDHSIVSPLSSETR